MLWLSLVVLLLSAEHDCADLGPPRSRPPPVAFLLVENELEKSQENIARQQWTSVRGQPFTKCNQRHGLHSHSMYRSYSHRVSRKVPGLIVENDYWNDLKADKIQQPIDLSENREVNSSPDGGNYLKVVCISDTHNRLNESHEIPDGDVLIVAGDITNRGDEEEIERFNHQMSLRPHKHKLVIAGNYEFGWDKRENLNTRRPRYAEIKGIPDGGRLLKGVRYLEDEEITIDGVKFYGSPWHPNPGYPFYADRNGGLAKKWERVPNDTDVLITHTPPLGYLDLYANEEHWGCRDLLEKVEEIAPKFHVFGHVHYCNGAVSNGRTIFINAAQLRKGKIYENSPIVFYIEKKKEDLS